jgi:hypothetical protein
MKPAVKILIPFLLGAAITGGLWAYTAFQGRGAHEQLESDLATCRKLAGTASEAKAAAVKTTAELTTCRGELDGLKSARKSWFCGLPDDKGSACFASRAECEAQTTACREQSFVVCAGDGHCFSDIWGCVKQATAGQACETRP